MSPKKIHLLKRTKKNFLKSKINFWDFAKKGKKIKHFFI